LETQNKQHWFLIINNLAFLLGISLSNKLWTTTRDFPVVPVLENLPTFQFFEGYLLVSILAILLVLLSLKPRPIIALLTLILIIYLGLIDQMRWQPWVYMHTLFIVAFLFPKKYKVNKLGYFSIILIGIYFWSGFHKLQPGFFEYIFNYMVIDFFNINLSNYSFVGYIVPIIEICIALGLLFKKTRKIAFWVAVMTHLVILAWLSPFFRNSNWVVIPWNLAMIFFLYFCFYDENPNVFSNKKQKLTDYLLPILALLVVCLPILQKFEKWPYYFSFHLYSGQGESLFIALEEDELLKQSKNFIKACDAVEGLEKQETVNVSYWSYYELGVPMPAEERFMRNITQKFCGKFSNGAKFILYDFPKPKGDFKELSCQKLKPDPF